MSYIQKPLLFLLILGVTIIGGCAKSDTTDICINQSNDHHISLEQALEHLDSFLSEMDMTKGVEHARSYSLSDITTISASDLSLETKSDSSDGYEGSNLLYIVNFTDEQGTAVLSADDRTDDVVLCVTDSGSLCKEDFESAYEELSRTNPSRGEEDIDFKSDMGTTVFPAIILSKVLSSVSSEETDSKEIKVKSLSDETKYGPYCVTKWTQSEINGTQIFNRFTPDNNYAGCVVIAVAQIIVNTKNIVFHSSDGTTCYRDTMLTVAHYSSPLEIGTDNAQVQVGRFVRDLGVSPLFCNVTYHSDGTTGNAAGAKRTLEAFGYQNVEKRTGFGSKNQTRATNQIRQGRPVYLGGCHSWSLSGHAWVLDGEWGNYYHVNWGWQGMYDGYFAKGVFDPQGGRSGIDSEVDDETSSYYTNETIKPYTWTYRMVTYSL